ncbi:sulfatase-like protein [Lacibacter cauensis]|uniref:Sulfatase-like protein n=1 Tax=Lacibacter cauensis TaxID=510947 RepID=A0A562SDK2_9BACT|nr:sulfatase-like hydrolase/transferase [Lacibacter cauensis]TWI79371.1 sulfatase-like protein [Lacibacter cauensis]
MQSIVYRSKVFLGKYPLFLFLLPVFFIYSGYNELFGFLSAGFIFYNFAIVIVSTFVVYAAVYFSMKEKKSAAIFTFFLLLFNLTFGFIFDSFKKITLSPIFGKYVFILPFSLGLFLILFIVLKKRKIGTDAYTFLNLLFIVLILSEIPNSIKRYQLDKSVHNLIDFRFNAYNEYHPVVKQEDSLKPDIYFLIFDAMASSKSILTTTGKSISDLDSFLTSRGFYLATNAKANYNWTIHSVSSTLNMDYLPPWIAPVMNDLKVYFWGSSSFKDNSLFRILQKENYVVNSYQPISFNNEQWPGDSYFTNLKKYHFSFKTLPGRIYKDIFWNYTRINIDLIHKHQLDLIHQRSVVKKTYFDTTISLVKQSCSQTGKPKFVYGHFMLPHEPYVFDSTGNLKAPEKTIVKNSQEDLTGYYEQLRFATTTIRELVTFIQANNKKNTIIIVAGDHGFKTKEAQENGYAFNNYSAFYFPDRQYQSLYDSVSPVNTFRLVLNKYYHANLRLFKDSSTLVGTENTEAIKKSEKIPPTHTPSTPNQ